MRKKKLTIFLFVGILMIYRSNISQKYEAIFAERIELLSFYMKLNAFCLCS